MQKFRALADDAATVFEQIHDASAEGKALATTRPLFDKVVLLTQSATLLSQSGEITVDPVLVQEFAQSLDELQAIYRGRPSTAAAEASELSGPPAE